ncbi:MAG: tyrosine-protein kinase family protein, partial [Kiritimatiellia bacterium]
STLSLKNQTGLTSVLVGEKHWREITARLVHKGQPVENLEILTAGPPSPNPSELLVSKAMKSLLAEARQAFEWVIVDTPPVLFVSDATVLGAMCDGVLLVVKADGNTRSMLIRAREQLHAVRARIVGAVLNDAVLSVVGRYYSTTHTSIRVTPAVTGNFAQTRRVPDRQAAPVAAAAGSQPYPPCGKNTVWPPWKELPWRKQGPIRPAATQNRLASSLRN